MAGLPEFTADGVLPEGTFPLTLDEIRESILVRGPGADYPQWDSDWRKRLVDNLEILVRELWEVSVTEIFIDGSFLEDKDHPNDVDGYRALPAPLRPDRRSRRPRKPTRVPRLLQDIPSSASQRRDTEGNRRDPEETMIRTDAEYQEARARLLEERRRLSEHEARMKEMRLTAAQRKRALDPLQSFSAQLEEEMEAYERAQRGSFEATTNLQGIGRLLIGARIYRGLSQRELAAILGVHESQVSRDERNEYRSITVERASRILEALGVKLVSALEPGPRA